MAEKIVSPGVFTNEIDQSFLPATAGPIGAAIVGPTVKGPILQPTIVSSYSEFVQIFGEIIESGSDKYQFLTSHTAQEYLRQGGPATIVRVGEPDLTKANATIAAAGASSTGRYASGSLTIAGTFGQTVNDETQITVAGTEYRFVAAAADTVPTDEGNLYFHSTGSNTATYIDNLVSEINNASIGVTAVDGTTAIILSASAAGTSGNDITVDTGSASSMADVLTLEGGVAAANTGQNLFTLEVLGSGPSFNNTSSVDSNGRLTPLTSSAGNNHWTSGSFGGRATNFRWEISQRNLNKGTFTLVLRQGNDETSKKKVIETFENISMDPESTNYILKRIGNSTSTIVVEGGQAFLQNTGEFPNKSKNIRVSSLDQKTPNYLKEDGTVDSNAYSDSGSYIPAKGSGSYGGSFSSGDFGTQNASHPFNFYLATDSDTNSQGVTLATSAATLGTGGYKTAINLLKNKDEFDIDLLFLPGILDQNGTNSNTIIGDAIQMCEDRGDCFLVYDNTFLTDTVANAKTNTEVRNSSYSAAYYPWVQIQDATTGNYRYVPPSVVMAGVYHFNDTIGQPWFAPAGLNRGGIDSAVQAYRKLTQGNRDDLYESNVNPIATFPGQGVTVFGQKTTQKKASALDRVNVRRLLINLKKFVANSSRNLVFEQNTTDLRNQFLNTVQPYMEQVQANQGLNAFRVVMDDTNNTAETIDRNQLVGQIFLQPTRTAEFIVLDFVVQPTGAAFPE